MPQLVNQPTGARCFLTEYLLKKQGEGSLQAAVSGYGKLEIQSKTQNDLGQIDRLDLLKKFVRTNFLALAVAHNNPGRYSQCRSQALPQALVMDNCKQRGSFPQAAVSGYGKLEI